MAEQSLLTAVTQKPNYFIAHERLAELYEKRLKNAEAAKQHRQLAEEAKEHVKALNEVQPATVPALSQFPSIQNVSGRLAAEDGEPLIVVSGLPRSGTSLMMQMLDAAGVNIVTDQKREADDSNQKGYFEDERVKQLAISKERAWLEDCRGQAIKIVAPLLGALPPELPVKVIFMQRDASEVIASQRAMLERDGKQGAATNDASLARVYSAQLDGIERLLAARPKIELLAVDFSQAVEQPAIVAEQVCAFLGRSADEVSKMASVADKALYRARLGR